MAVKRKRIGILTGGGDAPGLNGIIESSVRALSEQGYEVVGICDGFEGIFENPGRPGPQVFLPPIESFQYRHPQSFLPTKCYPNPEQYIFYFVHTTTERL